MSDKTREEDIGEFPEELKGMGDFMPQFTAEGILQIREGAKAREAAKKKKIQQSSTKEKPGS